MYRQIMMICMIKHVLINYLCHDRIRLPLWKKSKQTNIYHVMEHLCINVMIRYKPN
jgi:hypothetical protein